MQNSTHDMTQFIYRNSKTANLIHSVTSQKMSYPCNKDRNWEGLHGGLLGFW